MTESWYQCTFAGTNAEAVRSALSLMAVPENELVIEPWEGSLVRLASPEQEPRSLEVRELSARLGCAALHENAVYAGVDYEWSEWLHHGSRLLRVSILPDDNAIATFAHDGTSIRTRSIEELRYVLEVAWERLLRDIGPSARDLAAQSMTKLLPASIWRRKNRAR
jgi:hypothetical protein